MEYVFSFLQFSDCQESWKSVCYYPIVFPMILVLRGIRWILKAEFKSYFVRIYVGCCSSLIA